MHAMQRQDLREKHNIAGSCAFDLLMACCCPCCSVIQMEKESRDRADGASGAPVVEQQYAGEKMVMPGSEL